MGTVFWSFLDTVGMLCTFNLHSLSIPSANVHLLSTSSLFQHNLGKSLRMDSKGIILCGHPGGPPHCPVQCHVSPSPIPPPALDMSPMHMGHDHNRLPQCHLFPYQQDEPVSCSEGPALRALTSWPYGVLCHQIPPLRWNLPTSEVAQ